MLREQCCDHMAAALGAIGVCVITLDCKLVGAVNLYGAFILFGAAACAEDSKRKDSIS